MEWILLPFIAFISTQPTLGNQKVKTFRDAKRFAREIHKDNQFTIYCGCKYADGKVDLESCGYKTQGDLNRAKRVEWEHIVPAEAFGQSFVEWRNGAPHCVRKGKSFKGRKCAQTNPDFSLMEADLYNLWPEIGELNNLRSNYSFEELQTSEKDFGKCSVMIKDRKFMPAPEAKGIVARTYLYMDKAYPNRGIVGKAREKLFMAWSQMYPPSKWECERAARIEKVQFSYNPILQPLCSPTSLSKK